MWNKWKRNRLTKRLRKLEIKLAGTRAALASLLQIMQRTNRSSFEDRQNVVGYHRTIGELNTRIAHVQRDMDDLNTQRSMLTVPD